MWHNKSNYPHIHLLLLLGDGEGRIIFTVFFYGRPTMTTMLPCRLIRAEYFFVFSFFISEMCQGFPKLDSPLEEVIFLPGTHQTGHVLTKFQNFKIIEFYAIRKGLKFCKRAIPDNFFCLFFVFLNNSKMFATNN